MLPKFDNHFISPSPKRSAPYFSPTPTLFPTTTHPRRMLKRRHKTLNTKLNSIEKSWEAIPFIPSLTQLTLNHSSNSGTCKSTFGRRDLSFSGMKDMKDKRRHKLRGLLQSYAVAKEARMQEAKRTLCKALEKRYGVNLPFSEVSDLTESELLEHAKSLWRIDLARRACYQMKQWLTHTSAMRLIKGELARVYIAAFTIQLYWRKFMVSPTKALKLSSITQQQQLHTAAVVIQKMYRGYR